MRKSISFLLTLVMLVTMFFIPVTSVQVNAASDTGVKDFVTRMYKVCLDRKPDKAGLDSWTKMLVNHEQTGVSAAYGFVFSNEFQSKKCSNEQYVKYMYSAFFGRKPDTAGLNFWVDYLVQGHSRESVFCGFANSTEFGNLCSKYGIVRGYHIEGQDFSQVAKVNLFVERLYNVVLDRPCDNAGMEDWTTKLVNRQMSGCEVAYGFVFSQEFLNKHLCDSHYVEILYQAFMGRGSDASGKSYWMSELANGASREQVFNGFAGSQEFIGICNSYGIDAGAIALSGSGTHASGNCTMCASGNSPVSVTPGPGNNKPGTGSTNTPSTGTPNHPGYSNGGGGPSGTEVTNYPTWYPSTPTPTPGPHKTYSDIDVTKYNYEVIPFYENFNRYVLVKTDNPNPDSFQLYDDNTPYTTDKTALLSQTKTTFADVNYSDKSTGRFSGGYIFEMSNSDGGSLKVYEKYTYRTYYGENYEYRPTSKTIKVPKLYRAVDYVYNECVDKNKSFWDNMSTVQSYLNKYAIYPISLCDENNPTSTPYIMLIPPYYNDQYIMINNMMYNFSSEPSLAIAAYPLILDSISFPNFMANIAIKLDSNATVGRDPFYHYIVNVTYKGETKGFGGQGSHGKYGYSSQQSTETLLRKHLTKFNSPNQFDKDGWFDLLYGYWNKAIEVNAAQFQKFSSEEIYKATGPNGGWLRIYGDRYTYSAHGEYVRFSDAWVDGRYLDKKGIWIQGETFDKHSTADVMVQGVTYKNWQGTTFKATVTYEYDSKTDLWVAVSAYGSNDVKANSWRVFSADVIKKNSPELVLTRAQVEAMKLDRNTNTKPAHGVIYDGTAMPGTKF